MGLNRVEIADLSGQAEPPRPRVCLRRACSLDGLRLISATGAFQPAGVNYTAPVVTAVAAPPPHALSRHRLKPPGAGSCPPGTSLPLSAFRSGFALPPCPASCPAPDCACPAAWTWQRRLSARTDATGRHLRDCKDERRRTKACQKGCQRRDLRRCWRKSFLLADGATGTNLFAMGLESGEAPGYRLLEHPDRVQALHVLCRGWQRPVPDQHLRRYPAPASAPWPR